MENNKVKVKIYGQEYVIAGEKTREEIIQVAAHVDMKMQEVTEAAKAAGSALSPAGWRRFSMRPRAVKKPVNRYANMWARRWNRRVSSWSVLRPKRKMP